MARLTRGVQPDMWAGFYITLNKKKLIDFTCPCGVSVTYDMAVPINKSVKHPCKHKDHWTIKVRIDPNLPLIVYKGHPEQLPPIREG